MFATVTKEIIAGLQDDDKDPGRHLNKPKFVKLREDTALRIGMFDPEWALQFLEEAYRIWRSRKSPQTFGRVRLGAQG